MARERSPNRDKAKELYLTAKGEIKLTDIAAQLNVSDSQIRKWKSSDKWDLELNGALPMGKSNVTNQKGMKKKQSKKKKEPIAKEVEEVIESDGLTDKQRLFCIYYLDYFNASKAYQKAYGCQQATARVNASRLLTNANVKAEVDRLKSEALECELFDMKIIAKRVFQKYLDIAFADITDYLSFGRRQIETANGPKVLNYIDLHHSSDVDGTLISEISQGKDGIKVKLADKMRAMEFLAKHSGLLSPDIVERLELERKKVEIAQSKVPSKEQVSLQGQITALADLINNPVEERVLDDD